MLPSTSVKDIFKPIFLKIAFVGILLQIPPIWADSSNTFTEISPIITVREEPKTKDEGVDTPAPPSPGLSFAVPSAFGAGGGSAFFGVSYSADGQDGLFTTYNDADQKVADGSMNIGLGFGDPKKIGAEISIGIISLLCQDNESCFGADGTVGLKLHKLVEDNAAIDGIALGFSNIGKWGDASSIDTIYGVASKNFELQEKEGQFSLGIGTGGFRTKEDIDSGDNNPNFFGGIGVKLAPRVAFATSWNGSTLAAGFPLSPFDFPLSVSIGMTDLTDVNGNGAQYSVNLGYSVSY